MPYRSLILRFCIYIKWWTVFNNKNTFLVFIVSCFKISEHKATTTVEEYLLILKATDGIKLKISVKSEDIYTDYFMNNIVDK